MPHNIKTSIRIFLRSLNLGFLLLLTLMFALHSNCIFPKDKVHSNKYANLQNPEVKFNPIEPVILGNYSATGADSIAQFSFYNALASIGFPASKIKIEE